MDKLPGETSYECVMRRLAAREKGTPMSLEEANEILKGTTLSIHLVDRKYEWFAIMWETYCGFNTPRGALNDALKYLEKGGY